MSKTKDIEWEASIRHELAKLHRTKEMETNYSSFRNEIVGALIDAKTTAPWRGDN